MTPAVQCKEAGLKGLLDLSNECGVPVSTLKDWHRTKPELFKFLILGAVFKQAMEKVSK